MLSYNKIRSIYINSVEYNIYESILLKIPLIADFINGNLDDKVNIEYNISQNNIAKVFDILLLSELTHKENQYILESIYDAIEISNFLKYICANTSMLFFKIKTNCDDLIEIYSLYNTKELEFIEKSTLVLNIMDFNCLIKNLNTIKEKCSENPDAIYSLISICLNTLKTTGCDERELVANKIDELFGTKIQYDKRNFILYNLRCRYTI